MIVKSLKMDLAYIENILSCDVEQGFSSLSRSIEDLDETYNIDCTQLKGNVRDVQKSLQALRETFDDFYLQGFNK